MKEARSASNSMPAQTVIIKKYENRRLYDSTNSRYVNLEDIAQMVRDGADVQVVDAASGEDLTRQVLTQIIAENAKVPNSAFPLDLLRQMVVATGRMGEEGLMGYMKAMSQMYQNTYKTFVPPSPFDFVRREPEPAANGPAAAAQPGSPTIDELRQRVEDLERMAERNAAAKHNKKSKTSKPKHQ